MKYTDDPIGDGLVFSNLSKALKNAKELCSVTKAMASKNGKRSMYQSNEGKRKNYFKGKSSK